VAAEKKGGMEDYSSGEELSDEELGNHDQADNQQAAGAGGVGGGGRASNSSRVTKWDVARGIDPQGIPWQSLDQTRDEYR